MKGFIMKQNITTRSLSLTDTDFVATDSLIKCWKCNLYFQNAVKHVLYVQELLNSKYLERSNGEFLISLA